MAAIRAHARDAVMSGQPGHAGPLDAVGLIGTPIRTGNVLDELGDRLLRLRQSAWQLVNDPTRSIATLRDIATAGIAVHAHTATFHGANLDPARSASPPPTGGRALIDRGRGWQHLHAELRAFACPGRPDDVVRQDLIGIGRCLRTIAPLPGQAKITFDPATADGRRAAATLNGAVTVMADVGDYNARTFARIARTGQPHINARALTGAEITDNPDLVKAKGDGLLVPAPQPHSATVTELYDVVGRHPIRAPEAVSRTGARDRPGDRHGTRPHRQARDRGQAMTDANGRDINLPGWAEQSVWGYDSLLECYWAQLWRDEDRTDRPRIWISSHHLIPTLNLLARLVAQAVDQLVDEVYLAMTT